MKLPFEYIPSFKMEPGYLTRRFLEIKLRQMKEKEAKKTLEKTTDPFERAA